MSPAARSVRAFGAYMLVQGAVLSPSALVAWGRQRDEWLDPRPA